MNKTLCLILCCTVLVIGCSSQDKEANKLYVEACVLYHAVWPPDDGTEVETIDALKQVLQKLETILQEYPETDLAVKIAQGEVQIGGDNMWRLKNSLIPELERIDRKSVV